MGFSKEQRREVLEINGVHVYPQNFRKSSLQFLSSPAWSSDGHLVAFVDRDVETSVTSLTVIDARPERVVGPEIKLFDEVARPADVVMHAPIAFEPDERMEVRWFDHLFVVSPKGGAALYEADAAQRTVRAVGEDGRKLISAIRAQSARLKQTTDDLWRKLGGQDADIWTGPPAADSVEPK
jgi:hypothetical protein